MNPVPVYGIEADLEQALDTIVNAQIHALTPQDPQTFQKLRARAEFVAALGGSKDNQYIGSEITGMPQNIVENGWNISVKVGIITAADMTLHTKYRAWVRYFMFNCPVLINNVTGGMTNHFAFGPVKHLGTSPHYSPKDGWYRTDMNFGLYISVHESAWANLTI